MAISSKIRLIRYLTMSIFLYACETWTITAGIDRRIQALDMRCFRKLLGISYRDHITDEEVNARIGHAIGPYEYLLTSKKTQNEVVRARHAIIWTGQDYPTGNSSGGRRRGRQRKQWKDNVKEWTGLEWKAENR